MFGILWYLSDYTAKESYENIERAFFAAASRHLFLLDAPGLFHEDREVSLLLLIDGYNVVSPVAPPSRQSDSRWLQRERMLLLGRLADRLDDRVRKRTCVVFDAANPPRDRPDRFDFHDIDVRFAVNYPEADDLLEELIAADSSPKTLAVISSDHRVQAAAMRRGALPLDSEPWLDDLLDGTVRLAAPRESGVGKGSDENEKPPQKIDDDDVEKWMREFGF